MISVYLLLDFAILNTTIVIYRFQGFGCGFLKDSENERVKA